MADREAKISYTGLGLVYGTGIGAGLSIILTGTVMWAGIGTGIGLIMGAMIGRFKRSK